MTRMTYRSLLISPAATAAVAIISFVLYVAFPVSMELMRFPPADLWP